MSHLNLALFGTLPAGDVGWGGRGLDAKEGALCILQFTSPLAPSCVIYRESTALGMRLAKSVEHLITPLWDDCV